MFSGVSHIHPAGIVALAATSPEIGADAAVCVVLAAAGYPESPQVGHKINGFEEARQLQGIQLYASGIGAAPDGDGLVTAGGRVLGVGATGPTVAVARDRAYDAVAALSWEGMRYRHDIAAETAAVRA